MGLKIEVNTDRSVFTEDAAEQMGKENTLNSIENMGENEYREMFDGSSPDQEIKHPLEATMTTIGNRSSKKANDIITGSYPEGSAEESFIDQLKDIEKFSDAYIASFVNVYNEIKKDDTIKSISVTSTSERESNVDIAHQKGQNTNIMVFTDENVADSFDSIPLTSLNSGHVAGWNVVKGFMREKAGTMGDSLSPMDISIIEDITDGTSKASKSMTKALIYAQTHKGSDLGDMLKDALDIAADSKWSEVLYDAVFDAEEYVNSSVFEDSVNNDTIRFKVNVTDEKMVDDVYEAIKSVNSSTKKLPNGIVTEIDSKNIPASYIKLTGGPGERSKTEEKFDFREYLKNFDFDDESSEAYDTINMLYNLSDSDVVQKVEDFGVQTVKGKDTEKTDVIDSVKSKIDLDKNRSENEDNFTSKSIVDILNISDQDTDSQDRILQGKIAKEEKIINSSVATYRKTLEDSDASIIFVYSSSPGNKTILSGNSIGKVSGMNGPVMVNDNTSVYITTDKERLDKFNLFSINKDYMTEEQAKTIGMESAPSMSSDQSNAADITRWVAEKILHKSENESSKILDDIYKILGVDRLKTVDKADVDNIQVAAIPAGGPQPSKKHLIGDTPKREEDKEEDKEEDLESDVANISDKASKVVKEDSRIVCEDTGPDVAGSLYSSGKMGITITPKELFRQPSDADLYYISLSTDANLSAVETTTESNQDYLDLDDALGDKNLASMMSDVATDIGKALVKSLVTGKGGTLAKVMYVVKDIVGHFNMDEYDVGIAKAVGMKLFMDGDFMNPSSADMGSIQYKDELPQVKKYLADLYGKSGIFSRMVSSHAGQELIKSVKSPEKPTMMEKHMLSSRLTRLIESETRSNNIGCGPSSILTVNECNRLTYLSKRGFVKINKKVRQPQNIIPKMLFKICENNGSEEVTEEPTVDHNRIHQIVKLSNENVVVCSRDKLKEAMDKFVYLFEKDNLISEYGEYTGGYSMGGKPELNVEIYTAPSDSRMENPPTFDELKTQVSSKEKPGGNDIGFSVENTYMMIGNKSAAASIQRSSSGENDYTEDNLESADYTEEQKLQAAGLKESMVSSMYPLMKITKGAFSRDGLQNLAKNVFGLDDVDITPSSVKSSWKYSMGDYANDHEMLMSVIDDIQEKSGTEEGIETLRFLGIKPKGATAFLRGILNLMNKYKYV